MLLEPREAPLGGPRAMMVRRTLPHRAIRTIGAFCFVDHYGPSTSDPMVVPPHPHIGIQTVSWLLSGAVDHRDSVGSAHRIHPGELNLMTAGHGIAHSEYSVGDAPLHGIQLWVALPDAHRGGSPHFEHHADLPQIAIGGLRATVAMGSFDGTASPATAYSPLVCAEIRLTPGRHLLPVDASFEHGLLLVDGDLSVDGTLVPPTALRCTDPGPSGLTLSSTAGATVLLIGGTPLDEELLMWWNFVGRTYDEITEARDAWASGDDRFGHVVGDELPPLAAPALPSVRLEPRPGRAGRRPR